MKKKIIALSIASALTTPALVLADTANVNVYGLADLSLDMVKTGDGSAGTAATKGTTQRRVSSNVSRLGFKGSEALSSGLSAIWQMEATVAMDTGTAGAAGTNNATTNVTSAAQIFDRNTFIGVEGGFGRVVLGKHDTPYKIATRKLDVFADSIADNRSLMGGVSGKSASIGFDGRPSDVLAYISPTLVGITGAIALVNITEQNTLMNNQAKKTATSLAIMFGQGPIYAALGYETHNLVPTVGASTSEKAVKLGFGFTKDSFSVGAVVEKTSDDFNAGASNQLGHTAMTVNGKFNITANDAVKAAVAMAGKLGSPAGANTSAKQASVGYDHNMSKRTTVYAILTKLSNDNSVNYGLYGGGGGYNTNAGASPMALSLGVKHTF
ncbi:MAG TPA: porin [Gallionella sp.]|nr:porin [Gallionella sp.]